MSPSTLFFFAIVFAIQGLLKFHMKIRVFFLFLQKIKYHWNFDRLYYIYRLIVLGGIVILTIIVFQSMNMICFSIF